MCDFYTGYVWASKSGDRDFGTASKLIHILKEQIGTGLHLTETVKSVRGSQMNCNEFISEMKRLGIKMDFSSSKYAAGNLHAENVVKHVKRAIAHKPFKEAYEHIWALNMNTPYYKTQMTPFQALHGMRHSVSLIPMKPEF